MKYLQSGGGLYFSAAGSFAKQKQALEQAAAASASSKDSGLISDKLMEKLWEKGIPVDVDNFMNLLADFESDIDRGFGVNRRQLASLKAQANRIIQQAEYLKNAETNAEKKESLGEIAVGSRGQLFVIDNKHNISSVSASEYDPDKNGPALTVGELIEHRKFNPTLAYDTDITRVVNDNLGMSKISEYIQKIIAAVGSAETTNEAYTDLAGYVGREMAKRPTQEQLKSLQNVYEIMNTYGPEALFKIKDSEKGKNLQQAFLYIQSVLPRDMKTLLIGRNVAAGNKFETGGQYINSLIAEALYSANDTKDEHYISYDASLNKAAGADAKREQQRNLGVLEQLVQGSLGQRDYKLMSSKNPDYSINLHGNGVGSLATLNNNIIAKSPMSLVIDNALAPIVDEEHITIGNQKVSSAALESILYNGGDAINIWAPTTAEGDIDLEGLMAIQEVQKIIDQNPNLRPEDKQELLANYGLEGYFDDKNIFHGQGANMAQFLVVTGLTSDEVLDADQNMFADKLSKQEKDDAFRQIERIYGQLNKGAKGDAKYEFKTGWFNWSTDLYRVPIFMRLGQTAQIDVGTFSKKGPMVTTPTYREQLAYDLIQNSRPQQQVITPSSSALYG